MKILFVCLGNICRSPAAEGVARVLAEQSGQDLTFDSAGTGNWHVGNPPHGPMREVAAAQGYPIDDLRARQVKSTDFSEFDWIVAMDAANLAELQRLQKLYGGKAQLTLLLQPLLHGESEVPDPYYGDHELFLQSFDLIERGVRDFLHKF